MNDQDQSPEDNVLASQPAPVEVVPAQPSAEPQGAELQSAELQSAVPQTAAEATPEHKAHREPKDMLGVQAFFTVVIF
ncbi:MAG: hypothetical protein ACXVK3_07230, partial [Candidatus Angelobacter sp.]